LLVLLYLKIEDIQMVNQKAQQMVNMFYQQN
jgi:hypothetical protein